MGTIRDYVNKGGKLPGAKGYTGGSSTQKGIFPVLVRVGVHHLLKVLLLLQM